MNGESKEFVANETDMHYSGEDLEHFYDNVNSAACVSNKGNEINLWQNNLSVKIVFLSLYEFLKHEFYSLLSDSLSVGRILLVVAGTVGGMVGGGGRVNIQHFCTLDSFELIRSLE